MKQAQPGEQSVSGDPSLEICMLAPASEDAQGTVGPNNPPAGWGLARDLPIRIAIGHHLLI